MWIVNQLIDFDQDVVSDITLPIYLGLGVTHFPWGNRRDLYLPTYIPSYLPTYLSLQSTGLCNLVERSTRYRKKSTHTTSKLDPGPNCCEATALPNPCPATADIQDASLADSFNLYSHRQLSKEDVSGGLSSLCPSLKQQRFGTACSGVQAAPISPQWWRACLHHHNTL